ncbi:hypothetical protein Pth03_67590 [Planotetraspora thailandica]|uniref:DUF998 domain-containing protein n=1 Tax=Planotetraspora thailandica TaxID=487172 RepID=A0A8J3Y041_9ACTN|nr:hypothetical protein [Planotetraspora thailandica]GII58370.1 hypothetical protein Pth03_67590 [Planotetraspora thailandica]
MRDRVVGDLVKGQVCLFAGLLLCVTLMPDGLGANHGISYYGVHWETVLPYAASLLGAALFTRKALRATASATPSLGRLRRAADSFALLLGGIVLTPYTLNGAVDWTHRLLGACLFALQLVLAVRLIAWAHGDAFSTVLLALQLVGGVVAAVYVMQDNGFLLQGEATYQLGFGALLIRTIPLLSVPAVLARDTTPVVAEVPTADIPLRDPGIPAQGTSLGGPAVACCGEGDGGTAA